MLLNCGAAITSFVLVDTLTELPYLHARVDGVKYPSSAVVHEGQTYLIRRYGVGKRWNFVLCHCESFIRPRTVLFLGVEEAKIRGPVSQRLENFFPIKQRFEYSCRGR